MAPETLSLAGKVAIITGSGRTNGIGAGIATTLAANGARVVINYISDETTTQAAAVAQTIRDAGGEAAVVRSDISTPEGASKLVQDSLAAFGVEHIDILGESSVAGLIEARLFID
jgi:NAD(P)-dependent dehydrogenase (short-subunit alcohol dehydrogenase family)